MHKEPIAGLANATDHEKIEEQPDQSCVYLPSILLPVRMQSLHFHFQKDCAPMHSNFLKSKAGLKPAALAPAKTSSLRPERTRFSWCHRERRFNHSRMPVDFQS